MLVGIVAFVGAFFAGALFWVIGNILAAAVKNRRKDWKADVDE